MDLDLDERDGWPHTLRGPLDRHPRGSWPACVSGEAAFWLAIHDGFRQRCAALQALLDDYRRGADDAVRLALRSGPGLRSLLADLDGHHRIEDHSYFPAFRTAEPTLAAGFDALASDHFQLARGLAAAARSLTGLVEAARAGDAALRPAAERYAAATEPALLRLGRHLRDEEDLVVPLLLEGRA